MAETGWIECRVNLRVRRSFWHRETVPFRVRYRICHFATLIHTYLPAVKRIVKLDEYAALIRALAHMTAGGVDDYEPVLLVLAVVAEERFRTLYERPAPFLHNEIIEPLALVVEAVVGDRLNHNVVMVDEELFRLLPKAALFPPEQITARI